MNCVWKRLSGPAMAMALLAAFAGCEKKEKVLDIQTPGGGIEIEKSRDGVEIEIERKKKDSAGTEIRIETDGRKENAGDGGTP